MTYEGLCVFCILFLLKEKYHEPIIRRKLIDRLIVLPPQDIEFVMPQLSQMALTFSAPFADEMADLLVLRSANFMHFAIKLTWWLEAAAFYLTNEAVNRADHLIERIETAIVQGTPDVSAITLKPADLLPKAQTPGELKYNAKQRTADFGFLTNLPRDLMPALEDHSQSSTTKQQQDIPDSVWKVEIMNKKSRSDFFTAHLQLYRLFNSISTQLTPLSRPKRKQLLPYALALIKANGLYFPVFSALEEHFIVHQIYGDMGIVLNSRDKAPFLLWAKVEYTDKPLLEEGIYKPTTTPIIEASLRGVIESDLQRSSTTVQDLKDDILEVQQLQQQQQKQTRPQTAQKDPKEKPNVYDPFGETFEDRNNRILMDCDQPETNPDVSLLSVIFKGGDDCRQEVIAMQWISLFDQIFQNAQLPLQLRPYGVLVTSHLSGMIETIVNAASIDGVKKGLPSGLSFPQWFVQYFAAQNMYDEAQNNFVESMAAYSLVCYFLQIKDRHNGNIMLDNLGRLMHIDFGFMLSSSPGNNLNFENVPFKLTQEYIQIMGGEDGEPYKRFQAYFVRGFLEVRKHYHKFVMLADIMQDANIVAFKSGGKQTVAAFRARFAPDMTESQAVEFAVALLSQSCNHWRSSQYDEYQKHTNGIL